MPRVPNIMALPLAAAVFGAIALPATARAHSHEAPGEHIQQWRAHVADYEQEVAELVDRLDRIAERYAGDEDASGLLDAFVEAWESVDYHEVVERKAVPMYGPIWQGIADLRDAIENGKPAAAVREGAERTAVALHEGMGALKLRATMPPGAEDDSGGAGDHGDEGPAATIHAINEALDRAVDQYAEGEAKAAKTLIQNAYFHRFEGIEGGLIEQDADLVTGLEEDFNAVLPGLIDKEASQRKVRRQVDAMKEKLKRAERLLLKAEKEKGEVF